MSNSNGHVPSAFHDELAHNSQVLRAFEALGEPPRGWIKAAESARAAQWRYSAATSVHNFLSDRDRFSDQLVEAKRRLAAHPLSDELQNHVTNCERLLQAAEEIVAAATLATEGSANLSGEREQRRNQLRRMKEEVNVFNLRGLAVPDETTDALLNLAESVEADERAIDKERQDREALKWEADDLRKQAMSVLSRALDRSISDCADAVKGLLNSRQVAIGKQYPLMADPRIIAQFKRARGLATIALDLDGSEFDVDKTFQKTLSAEQYQSFSAIIWARRPGIQSTSRSTQTE